MRVIILHIHARELKFKCTCTCTSESCDKGVVHLVYAATKRGPLCRQSWNNEAKNGPIDIPQVARSLPSATGRTTLGREGAIIFWPQSSRTVEFVGLRLEGCHGLWLRNTWRRGLSRRREQERNFWRTRNIRPQKPYETPLHTRKGLVSCLYVTCAGCMHCTVQSNQIVTRYLDYVIVMGSAAYCWCLQANHISGWPFVNRYSYLKSQHLEASVACETIHITRVTLCVAVLAQRATMPYILWAKP